jgi:hypothetical protein
MSESAPTAAKLSPLPFVIMRIIADHLHAIEAITATSTDSHDYATLCTRYENAINLPHTLHCSKNLSNQFTMLVTETEDLALKCDAAISNYNTLTAQLIELIA